MHTGIRGLIIVGALAALGAGGGIAGQAGAQVQPPVQPPIQSPIQSLALAQPQALPPGAEPDLMRTVSIQSPDLSAFPHWRAALAETAQWIAEAWACDPVGCGDATLSQKVWLTRVRGLSRLPPGRRVREAIGVLNGLADIDPEGGQDGGTAEPVPWPTMQDILRDPGRGGLRLALARYYTLLAAGLPVDGLRIVNARDTVTLGRVYVVLVTTPEGTIAVTEQGVHDLSEHGYQGFIPVYAFDWARRWVYFPARFVSNTADLP